MRLIANCIAVNCSLQFALIPLLANLLLAKGFAFGMGDALS